MIEAQPRVFISYARSDDEPFVERLHRDLEAAGTDVWWDRDTMASRGRTFLQEIRDAIEAVDRVIAVIGPEAINSDYVRYEWEHALLFAKGLLPILRLGDYGLVPSELLPEEDQGLAAGDLSGLHCPDFRAERPYDKALSELVAIIRQPVPPLASYDGTPALPPHFLPRRDDLRRLKETVLADVLRPTVITSAKQTAALQGMGGIGKSVLASAFARAISTRRAMGDGIVWLSVGQDATKLTLLANIKAMGTAFGDADEHYFHEVSARKRLPNVLADKVCLIILDDVWSMEQVDPFRNAVGPRCRLLVTTRDGSLVTALGAEEHRVDILSDAQALALLAEWSGQIPLTEGARQVADECGNLPLALALCGAMARDGTSWPDLSDALRETDLSFIEARLPNYPFPNVLLALRVSVDMLGSEDPAAVRRYHDLAVFPKETAVPEATVLTLWCWEKGFSERNARKLLTTLARKALLTVQGNSPERRVSFHDLQHDYLRAVAGDGLPTLHSRLLDAYRPATGSWADMSPEEPYLWTWLSYHLGEAGREEELKGLLLDPAWIAAKLHVAGIAATVADYDCLPGDEDAKLVQGALRLSAHILAEDPAQLAGQLIGRLRGNERPALLALVADIEKLAPRPWLCPQVPSLTPPGGPLICTFTGHQNSISALSVLSSNDSMRASSIFKTTALVASLSTDGTFKLWDTDSSSLLFSLGDIENPALCFSPYENGIRILIGFQSGDITIFNMNNNYVCYSIHAHHAAVVAVGTLSSHDTFFSISRDGELATWHADSRRNLQRVALPPMRSGIHHAAVDSTKLRILVIHDNPFGAPTSSSWGAQIQPRLSIVDLESATVSPFNIQHYTTCSIAVTPDCRYAISCGSSGRFGAYQAPLRVWDLRNGYLLHNLINSYANVIFVFTTSDSTKAISCHAPMMSDYNTSLRLWDIESGRLLGVFEGHSLPVHEIKTGADLAVTCALEDNRILLWDLRVFPGGTQEQKLSPKAVFGGLASHSEKIVSLAVAEHSGLIVSGDEAGVIKCWNVAKGRSPDQYRYHSAPVSYVSAGRRDTSVVSCSTDGVIKQWDLEKSDHQMTVKLDRTMLEVDSRIIRPIPPSTFRWPYDSYPTDPCMAWPVTRSRSMLLCKNGSIWDVEWRTTSTPDKNGDNANFLRRFVLVSFSVVQIVDGGQYAAVGCHNGQVNIYDLQECSLYSTYKGHSNAIVSVAVSDDMSLVASLSQNGSVAIGDFKGGKLLEFFGQQIKSPLGVFFLRNDAIIILSDSCWGVLVLKLREWQIYYNSDASKLIAGAVSRDCNQVCCAQEGKILRVWDIETNHVVGQLRTDAPLTCVCAAARNRFLVGSKNGAVHVVSVAPGS